MRLIVLLGFVFTLQLSHQKDYKDYRQRFNKGLRLCEYQHVCYIKGWLTNGKFCNAKPYIPGGGIQNVRNIVAPKATLKQKSFLSIIAGTAGTTGNAGKILKIMDKFSKVFKNAAKMAPWLGALSGVFGFIGKKPSAQDAVNAANKAIKKLTEEVNNRMVEMKGYVDDSILKSESQWIGRQYQVLFNGWADCMVNEVTVAAVNECQKRAFADIRKSRSHFLLFRGKTQRLSRKEIKRLEVTFLSIRDYAVLNLMVMKSLVDSFKAEEGKRAYYQRYLQTTIDVSNQLSEYANYAFDQIMDYYDRQTRTSCRNSFKCGNVRNVDQTKWYEADRVMAKERKCRCRMEPDVLDHEQCTYYDSVRTDWVLSSAGYKRINFPNIHGRLSCAMALKKRAEQIIFPIADKYWRETSGVVRKYWEENVMKLVPLWRKIGQNANYELMGGNIALNRPTSQSSIWDAAILSKYAVDGNNVNCALRSNSCSHTAVENKPSWQVTLDSVYKVKLVVIYNRGDCCTDRLSNSKIYVEQNGQKRLCADIGDMNGVKSKEFKCYPSAIGNVVIVEKQTRGVLAMCEVEVYGTKNGITKRSLEEDLAMDEYFKSLID